MKCFCLLVFPSYGALHFALISHPCRHAESLLCIRQLGDRITGRLLSPNRQPWAAPFTYKIRTPTAAMPNSPSRTMWCLWKLSEVTQSGSVAGSTFLPKGVCEVAFNLRSSNWWSCWKPDNGASALRGERSKGQQDQLHCIHCIKSKTLTTSMICRAHDFNASHT